jgi:phosphatidylserine/phosphatidylglycerophosphate/cardiolipin synthase-like enzyme
MRLNLLPVSLFLTLFSAGSASLIGCSAASPEHQASASSVATEATDCSAYAAAAVSASCTACGDSSCQANGCYGGRACNTASNKCEVLPSRCSADAGSSEAGSAGPVIVTSFETPSSSGLQPVIDAINGARTSIDMEMFHLTVTAVADALVAAAGRGVDVQIIIDQGNWNTATTQALKDELANGGVTATPSSTAFRITHEKSFVVDRATAYIMSLNLTSPYVDTRDYAVVTTNAGVVSEFLAVFDADLVNAQNSTANTPTLSSPYLAWSPVNSEQRLAAFVESAESSLVVSSENLGDVPIQQALIAAAARGVAVRVLAPLCDENADATYDLPFLAELDAGGVTARAMPSPWSPTQPYEHAKMMIADGQRAFIGSVNFSTASTTDARELGIFFDDPASIQMISAAFESDWALGVTPPDPSAVTRRRPEGGRHRRVPVGRWPPPPARCAGGSPSPPARVPTALSPRAPPCGRLPARASHRRPGCR